jgi:hypothetical protein
MRLGILRHFSCRRLASFGGRAVAVTFTTRSFVDPVARVLLARLARADPSIPDRESLRASSVAECLHCWGPGSKDSDSDRMGGR